MASRSSFEEVIRLSLETEGGINAEKLAAAIRSVSDQAIAGGDSIGGLSDQLTDVKQQLLDMADAGQLSADELTKVTEELRQISDQSRNAAGLASIRADMEQLAPALERAESEAYALKLRMGENDEQAQIAAQAFAKTSKELEELRSRQARYTAEASKFEAALTSAGVSVDRLADEQTRLQAQASGVVTALRKQKEEAAALAGRLAESDAAVRRFNLAGRNAAEVLDKYRAKTTEAAAAQDKANASAGRGVDVFGRLRGVLASLGVALGLREAARGVGSILEVGDAAEKTRIKLEALYGSAEAGNKAFDELKTLAEANGQAFQQTIDAAAKLKGFGIEPLNGSLQSLIDQNAKLGGSQETLNGIILAVGQAWAKQKLQGEEILQLVERGVPVWDLLAQATGKNVQELQKLSEQGQLGRDVIAALLNEIGKSAEGQAARGLSTLSGLVTQAKNAFANFLQEVSDAGVLDYFKGQLSALNEEVKRLASDGTLRDYAVSVRNAIVGTAEAIKGALIFVRDYSGALIELSKAYAAIRVAQFLTNMAQSAAAMAAAGRAAVTAAGQIGGIRGAMAAIPGSLKIAVGAIGAEIAISQLIALKGAYDDAAAAEAKFRDASVKFTEERRALEEQQRAIIQLYADYSDEVVSSGDAVKKLTESEAASYAQRLDNARKYYDALARESDRVGDTTAAEAARKEADAYAAALEVVRKRLDELAKAKETAFGTPPEDGLSAALEKLGVDAETAGVKITTAGRQIIENFRVVATSATATGNQIKAAFTNALDGAKTTAEVDAIRQAFEVAYRSGRIGQEEYQRGAALVQSANQRIKESAEQAAGGFGAIAVASAEATRQIIAQWEATRAGLAAKATAIQASLAAAFKADPNYNGPLLQQYRDIDAQILALNTSINEGKKSLDSLGDSGQSAGSKIEGGIGKASSALRDAASAAGDAASGVEKTSDAATAGNGVVGAYINRLVQLKEEFNATSAAAEDLFTRFQTAQGGGVGQSLTDLFQDLEDAGIQTRIELANASTAAELLARDLQAVSGATDEASYSALAFGNRFGGNLARAGEEALRLVQDIEAVQAGAENARDDLKLLDKATLDQLKSEAKAAADAVSGIGEEAKSALAELQSLNRELQDEADTAAGNESAVLEREHQDRLDRIEELARTAGAAGAAEAAEARRRSEEQFAREMAQIAAKRAAEREAAAERAQSDRQRAAVTSTYSSPRTQGSQLPTPGGIVINISGDALDADALVRKLKPSLDRITRLYTGAR